MSFTTPFSVVCNFSDLNIFIKPMIATGCKQHAWSLCYQCVGSVLATEEHTVTNIVSRNAQEGGTQLVSNTIVAHVYHLYIIYDA